jgi:hypothetical protein
MFLLGLCLGLLLGASLVVGAILFWPERSTNPRPTFDPKRASFFLQFSEADERRSESAGGS